MEGQPCQRMAGHTQLGGVDKNSQAVTREIDNHPISQKLMKYLQHLIYIT